jgi:hypothetical protein
MGFFIPTAPLAVNRIFGLQGLGAVSVQRRKAANSPRMARKGR